MAWVMFDDLSGARIPDTSLAGRVSICIDTVEVHAFEHVGPREDLRELLRDLGERLADPIADAVDPNGRDDAPSTGPEREPDAVARAEDLLDAHWSPARIAGELGIDLDEVAQVAKRRNGHARSRT